MYVDKDGNRLQIGSRIRFLKNIGSKTNPFLKGEVGFISNVYGVEMVVQRDDTTKHTIKTLVLTKIDYSHVELVK